jgi:hypothetical protein
LAVDATAGQACPPSAAGQVGVFDRGNALVAWPLGGRDLGGRRHIRCGKLVHGSDRISLSQVSAHEEEREAAVRAALAAGTGIRKMARLSWGPATPPWPGSRPNARIGRPSGVLFSFFMATEQLLGGAGRSYKAAQLIATVMYETADRGPLSLELTGTARAMKLLAES